MLRLVVLISGSGTNLRALLEAADAPDFPARVVAVGADVEAEGLAFAEERGIPTFVVPFSSYDTREAWGDALLEEIRIWDPDLTILSGFMRLLPAAVVRALTPALLNTHPAFLPEFPGAHGVRDAIAAGVNETGASVIVVDDGVDTGPVLAQERIPIEPSDSEASLHARIKPVERRLLAQVIRDIANGTLRLADASFSERHPEGEPMSGATIDPTEYRPRDLVPIRRALVAVSDKTGLVELARALADAGVEIVSTGGTGAAIAAAGLPVTQVQEVTGYPEHLDGRVRTLHPGVHSGLLADLRLERHERELGQFGIKPFELVVVNLYPFVETVRSGAEPDQVVEQIDIGGPAMVRAAAKNHANVAVVTDPARYGEVVAALSAGGTTLEQRRGLARDAYRHTAGYDIAVASWFGGVLAPDGDPFPGWIASDWDKLGDLRYGENSHQRASLFGSAAGDRGIAQARQLGGKEMSYNNYVDADAALRAAYDHDTPAIAIIKHANPCGIATAATLAEAHAAAHACDPVSAFGGVIAANRPIDAATAESIAPIFTEVVVAPGFSPEAVDILGAKKNLRLLEVDADFVWPAVEVRSVSGGRLVQESDQAFAPADTWQLVAGDAADAETLASLEFAWIAVRAAKSNAILLARGAAAVGIGMGQVNRVDSCRLAVDRANSLADGEDRARGAVAASDAFFPFADGLQILIDAGVKAVVQPGGSVRDDEVIAAAQAAGVTMYFTGERHFFH